MNRLKLRFALLLLGGVMVASGLSAQTYAKLNGLYALAGVINPAVEFTLSQHATFQTEVVISPWKYVNLDGMNKPMTFGIFLNEYRYFFREHNSGWYVGGNGGLMVFNMTKPSFEGGSLGLKPTSAKGYGIMFGAMGGYEWVFNKKWMVDAFFGWSYMLSQYNGYSLVDGLVEGGHVYNRGEIIMTPHGHENLNPPDPFNGSAEWLPNKIGVSVGLLIFDPAKRR